MDGELSSCINFGIDLSQIDCIKIAVSSCISRIKINCIVLTVLIFDFRFDKRLRFNQTRCTTFAYRVCLQQVTNVDSLRKTIVALPLFMERAALKRAGGGGGRGEERPESLGG